MDLFQELLSFLFVCAIAEAGVAGEFAILVDDTQANDFIAVFDQFLDEPFDGVVGVVVVVGTAEEGSGALIVLVVFVFGGNGKGVVGCVAVVKSIEGDSAFVFT